VSSVYVPAESLLQSRAFRRLFAFSLAGHLIVFAALVLRPSRHARLISPSPVMVQVVSAPKAAAPKPAPAKLAPPPKAEPKPEPAPPPPKPVVKEIVIPKDVKALPEKPKPAPAPVEKKAPPPTAEELLAKITERVEAQEAANAPPAPPSEAPAPIEGAPGEFDPLLSPWVARVKAMVRANWSGAAMCKGAPQFDVDIDAGGQLTHIQLAQSSGDRYCDATAERALQKSNPLPPPPSALSLTLDLRPTDEQ
jgi:TonB family protein